MVGSIHHKLYTFGNSAELANNQSVTDEVVEMSDMLLKLIRSIYIIIIGIVAYDNTRILHHVFDEAEARNLRIRKCLIRIGPVFYIHKF